MGGSNCVRYETAFIRLLNDEFDLETDHRYEYTNGLSHCRLRLYIE